MFCGRYTHNLDAKGRLTIPATFREHTPEDLVYITKGFDKNLAGYSKDGYKHLVQSIVGKPITDPNVRDFKRDIIGNTFILTYDSAGRILIPAILRELAGIEGQAVIVGVGDCMEIWDPKRLDDKEKGLSEPDPNQDRWNNINVTTRGF